jgi:hypothetical protein
MPIRVESLETAAGRRRLYKADTLTEAKRRGIKAAFLCHSHSDKKLVEGLLVLLSESGLEIYVDWADATMPVSPTKQTALKIQTAIREADLFLFLATHASVNSRWCPWEIGFADGVKKSAQLIVIPTQDRSGTWHGSEYLQLYRRVDLSSAGDLVLMEAGSNFGSALRNL